MGRERQGRHAKVTACGAILHGVTGTQVVHLKLGGSREGDPDLPWYGKPMDRGAARERFWEDPERAACTEVGLGGGRPLQQARLEVGG